MLKPIAQFNHQVDSEQLNSRIIQPRNALNLPFNARLEYIQLEKTVSDAMADDQISIMALEIPKGEIWYLDWARITARFGASTSIDAVKLEHWQYGGKGDVTGENVDWSIIANPVSRRISDEQTSSGATSHTLEWWATDKAVANSVIYYPIMPELSVLGYSVTLNDAAGATMTSFGVSAWIRRVQLGEALLETLRNKSISDVELQRLLQATGVSAILRTDVT